MSQDNRTEKQRASNSREPFEHREIERLLCTVAERAASFIHHLDQRSVAHTDPERPEALDLPSRGHGAEGALELFRERYELGLSGSAGPRYLGFVTGGSTPAALAGDWLASAYDQNLSNDGDSVATWVEREALGLLRQLFGLGDHFEGAFVSGATMANAVSLATARESLLTRIGRPPSELGLYGSPPITVVGGTPHASVEKALSMLGMGRSNLVRTACLPGRQAVDPGALERRVVEAEGPVIVIASAGEVNTGDFDDLEALAAICERHEAWLHVDGAFGLFAACVPELAPRLAGLERADSVATDGHKWLNVPYDSGLVFTRHLDSQEKVFRAAAAYLGEGEDLLHRTPENSRRFRALPAWATLMAYGKEGYQRLVERNCAIARALGEWLDASPAFELLAPVHLDIVCFALAGAAADAESAKRRDAFLAALAEGGRAYLTPTVFGGRPGMRAAFVNWRTTDEDLEILIEALGEALDRK